jgi:hypothetical protein
MLSSISVAVAAAGSSLNVSVLVGPTIGVGWGSSVGCGYREKSPVAVATSNKL